MSWADLVVIVVATVLGALVALAAAIGLATLEGMGPCS